MPAAPAARVVVCSAEMDGKNKLYFGDNLKIHRDHVTVSSDNYNVLFKRNVAQGPHSHPAFFQLFPAAQITAFDATRESDANS